MLRRTLFWRQLLEERWEEGLRCCCLFLPVCLV